METKTIQILPITQILNQDSAIGIASVQLPELLKFVKYTQRTEEDEDNYQREIDIERVKGINKFILDNIFSKLHGKSNVLGLFPSSTILAVETNSDFDDAKQFIEFTKGIESEILEGYKLSFFNNESELIIAEQKNVLIVDGQHRIYALDLLYRNAQFGEVIHTNSQNNPVKLDFIKQYNSKLKEEDRIKSEDVKNILEKFNFICTFLIDFDLYEQSQIFASVNFNQKPVNKSIYYDIFGSVPDLKNNDLNLAHNIVEKFRENSESVLKSYINMLGKGSGLISQAFLIEAIRPFLKSGIWSGREIDYSDLNSDYIDENSKSGPDKKIVDDLKVKLNDIENELYESLNSFLKIAFEKWEKYIPLMIEGKAFNKEDKSLKYNHILLKTVGLGSLIKFYEYPFRRIGEKPIAEQNIFFREIIDEAYKSNTDIFSNEKNGGASGLGTRNKVFNQLLKPALEKLIEKENLSKKEQRVVDAINKTKLTQ